MTVPVKPEQAPRRLSMFVGERAIPPWGEAGFDDVPRRLMVQARQIVVYSRACPVQRSPGRKQLALGAFENAGGNIDRGTKIQDGSSFPCDKARKRKISESGN